MFFKNVDIHEINILKDILWSYASILFSLNFCLLILHLSVDVAYGSCYWWCHGCFSFIAFSSTSFTWKIFLWKVLPHASFI